MTRDRDSLSEKVSSLLLSRLIAEMSKDGELKLTLTVPQAAKLLKINKIKMYEIARSESFPSLVLGNRILIPIIPFMDWIEKTSWDQAI